MKSDEVAVFFGGAIIGFGVQHWSDPEGTCRYFKSNHPAFSLYDGATVTVKINPPPGTDGRIEFTRKHNMIGGSVKFDYKEATGYMTRVKDFWNASHYYANSPKLINMNVVRKNFGDTSKSQQD